MAKVIKSFVVMFFTGFFTNWLEDFFILAGIGIIVFNTYLITIAEVNVLAGNYTLGVVLIIIGLVLAKR